MSPAQMKISHGTEGGGEWREGDGNTITTATTIIICRVVIRGFPLLMIEGGVEMIDRCQYPVDVDAYGSVGMLSAEIPHVVPFRTRKCAAWREAR